MNRWIAFSTVGVFVLAASMSAAAEGDGPSLEDRMAQVIALGPGVHGVQKNKDGRITSLVVVGQARISTVLGKSKGLELARSKADLACSAEFVQWLKAEITVYESSDEEAIILSEGDGDSAKESGKSVEKSSTKMESLSKGLVRGLQVLHKNVDGEGQTYTVVKGWKADSVDGVKRVAAELAFDAPKADPADGKKTVKPRAPSDNQIKNDSATSEDAADFFPSSKSK